MKVDRSDIELIEAIKAGDPRAFETLYHRYRDWVHRLAWRFTGDEDAALDVLQETFAYLVRKFPDFTLTARMTTFLYPVVKHLSLALKEKSRRLVLTEEILDFMPAPPAERQDETRAELAQVLTSLPPAQREVVLMRFVDGMTLEEIAAALEIAAGTVKSRLYRALEQLRHDRRTRRYFLE